MRKTVTLLLSLSLSAGYVIAKEWHETSSQEVDQLTIEILEASRYHNELKFYLDGFYIESIDIENESHILVTHEDAPAFLNEGFPELPRVNRSLVIPNAGSVEATVTSIEFEEYHLGPVAPSKGNLLRTQNPNDVPYIFDEFYQTDEWFPAESITLSDPFIFRGVR